jgi:glycosyltransferase involved in cell wall biosynthesis
MKFLFDTVFTQRPRICSTHYLVWELIEKLIAWRSDTFFYVLYPPHKVVDEEDLEFMDRFPDRVKLLPLPQSTLDRTGELYMLRNTLRFYLNPWCEQTWDTDIVVSSRIPVLKHYCIHAQRAGTKQFRSHRMYVGLEEMPILPFRPTVPWFDDMYPDQLLSYAMTDATLVNNQWTKTLLKPVLKDVFSPAWSRRILDRLHEVVPVKLQRLKMRTELYQTGQPFELAFVGRMTTTRNFQGVMEVFRNQFSYPIGPNRDKIQFKVSTNSQTWGSIDPGEVDFVDIQMNSREKFYEFLKAAHLAVNLSEVEDFSLATYETLMAGVPVIVADKPWSQFLGSSYPFRVSGEREAYGMVSAIAADYARMYAKFKAWEETYWRAYVAGPLNVTTAEKLIELVTDFEHRRQAKVSVTGGAYRQAAQEVPVGVDGCIDLTQWFKDSKTMRMYASVDDHYSNPVGKTPNTLLLKCIMQEMGYRDTILSGILQRIAVAQAQAG